MINDIGISWPVSKYFYLSWLFWYISVVREACYWPADEVNHEREKSISGWRPFVSHPEEKWYLCEERPETHSHDIYIRERKCQRVTWRREKREVREREAWRREEIAERREATGEICYPEESLQVCYSREGWREASWKWKWQRIEKYSEIFLLLYLTREEKPHLCLRSLSSCRSFSWHLCAEESIAACSLNTEEIFFSKMWRNQMRYLYQSCQLWHDLK